jgi:hypothetical protein
MSETFRVVKTTTPTPSALHATKRHATAEAAVAEMGEGVVLAVDDTGALRLVAFHQRHIDWVMRTDAVVQVARPCSAPLTPPVTGRHASHRG